METSIKSSAINYGLYLGIGLIALTILGYAIDLAILTKWYVGISMLIIIIVVGIMSAAKSKSIQNGFISFKDAFSSYFITVAIALIMSVALNIILFNYIDPDAAIALKEKTIEATVSMMKNFNAPAETIAEAVEQMEAQPNNYAIKPQILNTGVFLVIQAVIGLIVALIMKKEDQNA